MTGSNTVFIGRRGENLFRVISFDVASLGDGQITAMFLRPGEALASPVNVEAENGIATWSPSAWATQIAGVGKIEFRVSRPEDVLGKTVIYYCQIANSLNAGDAPPPSVDPDWYDEQNRKIEEALQARDEAQTAAAESIAAKDEAVSNASDSEIFKNEAAHIMGLATFGIDTDSGELFITYPAPYYGATFSINSDGYLEVSA